MLNSTPYKVSKEHIDFYQKHGCIKLKQVLSADEINEFGPEITRKVFELNTLHLPMEQRSTYQKAFLQITNLWTKSEKVKEFVFNKRIAGIAAQLMRCDSVRLYHDQALYKEPSGGFTPWHADQFYWPLATDKCTTVWIPLQETPVDMGALEFSMGSQNFEYGRDLPISDESEQHIQDALEKQGFELLRGGFDLGEVSFHAGWTFHRAGPNTTSSPRAVMTMIYMDADMTLKSPDNDAQKLDWEVWCPGAEVGEVINTPLNPLLWP
jgi:ectoine hydroxylase-related dioxygenase (phytanoyl-CoA dioxygenase family)